MGDERSTVEAYAAAVAQMVDPFANRSALLEGMALDESGWRELDARWRAEIQRRVASGDRSLADAFAAAFARESQRIAEQRNTTSKARSVARAASDAIDQTAVAAVVLEPALPFAGFSEAPPPAGDVTIQDGDLDSTAVMADDDDLGLTLPFDED